MRFPDFNDEWTQTTLGEIGETYTGLSGKSSEDFGKGSPYITYKMVYDGVKINLCNTEYVYVSESEKQNQVRLGDILFTTSSETPEETGLCSVLLSSSDELYLNSFCFGYRLNEESLATSIFLGYALRSPIYRIKLSTLAQGSTRYNISKSEVMCMPISLPTLAEQKKIADFLSLIDERINNLSETIKELKTQKAALLNQLFSQKLRFPDYSNEWTTSTISKVCKVATGSMNTQDKVDGGDYPFYVRSSTIERSNRYTYDGIAILTPGDGAIGKIFHYSEGKIAVHQRVYILSEITIDAKYLFYYFSDKFYNRVIRMSAKNTVDSVRINMITDMPLSLPSLAEQKKIADFLSLIDERIEVEEQLLQQYEKQKRYLLKQMFV